MGGDFIVITAQGQRTVPALPGETFARALFRAGFFVGVPLCAGLGRCGRCRARFVSTPPPAVASERKRLTPEELAAGYRLTCLHPVRGGEQLEVPETSPSPAYAESAPAASGQGDGGRAVNLGLAVDLGTTGLAWRLLERDSGRVRGEGRGVNPQLGAGGEVVSRLAYAAQSGGGAYLRGLVFDVLDGIVAAADGPVSELCVAGNSAMVSILCDKPLMGLSLAPYHLEWSAGETVHLRDGLPPTYIPPLLGPFVGADLSAGLTALLSRKVAYPFFLADLGTNAEMVLGLAPDRFLAASAPLGPALEGVGLSQGALAGPGVAVDFALTPTGLAPIYFDGRAPAPDGGRFIAGPGYLALAARLVEQGVLDRHGHFDQTPSTPLAARLARGVSRSGGEAAFETAGYRLWASDVEEMLKVKAACAMAMAALFSAAGLAPADVASLYLAGAFGAHVAGADLETLGFLPPGMGRRAEPVGNLSLEGASLFLTAPETRQQARYVAARTTIVPLVAGDEASDAFIRRMVFAYVPD